MIEGIIQFTSHAASTLALACQIKSNRSRRSVYGLSFDMVLLTFLQNLGAASSYLFYQLKSSKLQYIYRYPLQPEGVPNSLTIFLMNLVNLLLSIWLFIQVFAHYKHTINIEQSFSWMVVALIIAGGIFLNGFLLLAAGKWFSRAYNWIHGVSEENVYVHRYINGEVSPMGDFGLFWLDFVYLLQVESKLLGSTRLWPQVSLNFTSFSKYGLCLKSIKLELISAIILIMGKVLVRLNSRAEGVYDIPKFASFNYVLLPYGISQGLTCLMLLYLRKLYAEYKPSLQLKYHYKPSRNLGSLEEEGVELQNLL